ncbi:MAG: choice-of-anchor J domain-containing protein [Reichenbachiella sp.]
MQKSLLYILLSLWIISPSIAQDKCGTVKFNEQIYQFKESETHTKGFEDWINKKIQTKRLQQNNAFILADEVLTIPVVVHIVHQGEAVGIGSNIPDEQILAQIATLNEDFRRNNADASDTPSDFIGVAADTRIEFVLAKQDPEGLPTSGILRTQGSRESYGISNALELANESAWPAEDYLNIWVTNLTGDTIGFAQFPLSNLDGLNHNDNNDLVSYGLTDGVYSDYEYFGTGFNAADFSKGRTVTHETGHWLGLRHVWGDGGCSVDDYCDDTPAQSSSSSGCPIHPELSCSSNDMFQNYMDYTDDVCMNLFTTDQKNRMRVILENSPRRESLLTSKAKDEPIQVDNDLGIVSILSPAVSSCETSFTPALLVRNYGTNTITDFTIDFTFGEETVDVPPFEHTLEPLGLLEIELPDIGLASRSEDFTFKVTSVNNTTDGNQDNDCQWATILFPVKQNIPILENFTGAVDSNQTDWNISNETNASSWFYTTANNGDNTNECAVLNYFGSDPNRLGERDFLTSPVLNLTGIASVDLSFKMAFSNHPDFTHDGLAVIISTDCGTTFPIENLVYERWANDLTTTNSSNTNYTPSGIGDWKEININFGEFINEESVVIGIVGSNGSGNNMYIDDIQITTDNILDHDISIESVDNIPISSCINSFQAQVNVRNLGFQNLTQFTLSYDLGGNSVTEVYNGLDILPGKTTGFIIKHEQLLFEDGTVNYEISLPNGETDLDPRNNEMSLNYVLDDSEEDTPFKIYFASDDEVRGWTTLRRDNPSDWKYKLIELNRVLYIDNTKIEIDAGTVNYFTSPSLNVNSEEATLQFDVAYAYQSGFNDRLQVLASTNCGLMFDHIVYDKNGVNLSTSENGEIWEPTTEDDWRRESIDLSEFAYETNLRLSFAFTSQKGNNIYLDNMEMYHTTDPDTIDLSSKLRVFPNPVVDDLNIKFNYRSKQDLTVRIVSMSGKTIYEEKIENILNQIHTIRGLAGLSGLYVLNVYNSNISDSQKIMIVR